MKTRRKARKKRSVVDSAARNAASLSDGCNPELVKGADFDGIFEMPIIKKPKDFIIPDKLIPFSKLKKVDSKSFAVCEYENDSQIKHIMKEEEGHLPDTPQNREFLVDLANNKKAHIGKDHRGIDWHATLNKDGSQNWVSHRNGVISDGGVNKVPRVFDEETGLKNNARKDSSWRKGK